MAMKTQIRSAAQSLRFGASSAALIAAALLAMNAGASAYTITVQDSGSIPFTPINLGTSATAGLQSSTPLIGVGGTGLITFSGGSSLTSGVYAGSVSNVALSPFALGLASQTPSTPLLNYLVAQGGGGSVTITYKTPQTSLDIVWGSVDIATGYNLVVTAGLDKITGAQVLSATGLPSGDTGLYNVAVELLGLAPFSSVTFSDSSLPAFEFDVGVPTGGGTPTPLPAALPLFAGGVGALGFFGWRRKRKPAAPAAA
jgi:hypothetical protein